MKYDLDELGNWPFKPLKAMHYGVILADPPWTYKTRSEKGQGKSPSLHYNTMTLEDICALPVHLLAADDCMLVMWTTAPHLQQSLVVMEMWGFDYATAGAWAKQSKTGEKWAFGTGYVYRSAAEFYIVGKIGSPKTAAKNIRNLIVAPVREHSRKPDEMHDQLERMFPSVPRCELFSRNARTGWDHWGLEAGKFDDHHTGVDLPRRVADAAGRGDNASVLGK
jgi:N6-adenosine-specific RNA methylase IME4